MKIAISNIAWELTDEPKVAGILVEMGVTGVEVAPTRMWPVPLEASPRERRDYREFWESRGIRIVALQALLFGREDLTIFADADSREATRRYLEGMIGLAASLGAHALVFGSPRNRRVGDLDPLEARSIAIPFFGSLGAAAERVGVSFCIEPNAAAYGCDYVTNTADAIALVEQVGSPGFGLHLDTGVMTLNNEAPDATLAAAAPWLRHFHISEPFLARVGAGDVPHAAFAEALDRVRYPGWRSIEMRGEGSSEDAVREAVRVAVATHGRASATT